MLFNLAQCLKYEVGHATRRFGAGACDLELARETGDCSARNVGSRACSAAVRGADRHVCVVISSSTSGLARMLNKLLRGYHSHAGYGKPRLIAIWSEVFK